MTAAKVLRIVDGGVLFRNPLPGHQAVSGFLPFVVEIPDGDLVCIYRRGSAFYSNDGVLAVVRSSDGGATWRDGGLVGDASTYADATYSGPFAAALADGSIALIAIRRERSDGDRLAVNQATGGFLPVDTVLFLSPDGGATWMPPIAIAIPGGRKLDVSGPIVEQPDGSWFLPFDSSKDYDDPSVVTTHMVGLLSRDRGETWQDWAVIARDAADLSFFHGRVVPLRDGGMFTLAWTRSLSAESDLPIHEVASDPSGRQWSTPVSTGIPGQTSFAIDLDGGDMVAAYTYRGSEKPGIRAVARVAGQHWDLEHEVQVWDATGRETIGVASVDTYPQSHDVIAFGRPVGFPTREGDILVSFWCTDMSLTQCRWARLRLD